MNKCDGVFDISTLPFGSIPISAKENIGIQELKRQILHAFRDEYIFCELFVPYSKFSDYAKLCDMLKERNVCFEDSGKVVQATIPKRYAEFFTPYIK
jgi:50S ribosomal subunit-associated GTPase HflX